jgi:hypothetical protein
MKNLLLVATILLTHCVRNSSPSQLQEDTSIVFPRFYERAPTTTGEQGEFYHMDGPTLVALATAANDFAPRGRKDTPCWDRQEALLYQFIRQGDIIFVRIDNNAFYCANSPMILDGGAQYAISLDGRILRRVFDGEPVAAPSSDAGAQETGEPVSLSDLGKFHGEPDPAFLEKVRKKVESMRPDSGVPSPQTLDGGSPALWDAGSSAPLDGGL